MTRSKAPAMGGVEWVMLLTLSFLWGSSFFFYKILVNEIPPFTIVLGRVAAAALALNLFLLYRRDPLVKSLPWGPFVIMGLLNNVVPFSLIAWSETRIGSELASILIATAPIFTLLIAHVLTLDDRLTTGRVIGVAFGVLGVVVLVGPGHVRSMDGGDLLGPGACLAAAVCYAFAAVYGRRFQTLSPLKVAAGQVTGATCVALPLALVFDRFWTLPVPSAAAWGSLAGIAIFGTALAYGLYFRILAVGGATNLILVNFLVPGSALLFGGLILGESLDAQAVAGMALIGASIAAIDGRLAMRLRTGVPMPRRTR